MIYEKNKDMRPVRVAIPYYGPLVRPGKGFEKVFFLADVNTDTGELINLLLQVWNPEKGENLAGWLKSRAVGGILCSDNHPGLEPVLRESGVWACWNLQGEMTEIIQVWLNRQAA